MGLFDMLGRGPQAIDEMEEARRRGMPPQGQPPVQPQGQPEQKGPSLWERFNKPQNWAAMSNAFNTLRFQPDQGLAAANQAVIERATLSKDVNKTVQLLRAKGTDAATSAADMIESNPGMAKQILQQYVQLEMNPDAKPVVSGVQTDPVTGQQYTIQTGPDGISRRVNVDNAIQQTPQQILDAQSQARLAEADQERAADLGQAMFEQSSSLDGQIDKLTRMTVLLEDPQARTGIVNQFLPAFNSTTSELRSMANQLGIDVINSATFGALSEKELQLALSTAIDLTLPPDELQEAIRMKIAAQTKLRNELLKKSRSLTRPGARYSEYIDAQYRDNIARRRAPEGVDPEGWRKLSVDDRIEFLELGGR